MLPAERAAALARLGRPSPWPGYECLRGFSVPALACSTGDSWRLSLAEPPLLRAANALDPLVPERAWRWPALRRARERFARTALKLGDVELAQTAPSGQAAVMMPRRLYLVDSSSAMLDGRRLGEPVRADGLAIGCWRLPARPFLTFGNAYFAIDDADEYRRTIEELERDPVAARVRFGC